MATEAPRVHECNAVVDDATIRIDRGFALSMWLTLNYGGSIQGFGGWVLGGTPDAACGKHAEQKNLAAEWIVSCLRVCGVESVSECAGKVVRVRQTRPYGEVIAIGHAVKDIWFDPKVAIGRLIPAQNGGVA